MAQENDTARPVWLTREQRDHLNAWVDDGIAGEIVTAWDAAPEDAAEALAKAIGAFHSEMRTVKAGLAALGSPNA